MHPARDKRVFEKEAISLLAAGHHVCHICPGDFASRVVDRGVRIATYRRSHGIFGRITRLSHLYRLAKSENADVYHCNEVDSWAVGVALKILRSKRCVFDVHEHYPSTFAESRFPSWLQPTVAAAVRAVFRLFVPFTDRLVLAKRSVGGDFPGCDEKIVLVRNFTSLSNIDFVGRSHRIADKTEMTLVHLGLLSKLRGWPQMLEALATMRHKNVRLLAIGEMNDGSRPEFDQRVGELGLRGRVHLLDWMPFPQALAHLAEADIGIIAFQPGVQNHVYAMPHKMFDYMAAGLAVLLPKFAVEVAPVIAESQCGSLIDPADPKDIAAKLDDLLDAPEQMRAMGERGRQAVRDRYNWEAEAERLVDMYKDLERLF